MKPAPAQEPTILEGIHAYHVAIDEFGDDMYLKDEDCLYLNVYTPNPHKTADLPVIVWVHGGGFTMADPHMYSGTVMCSLHDVIFVVITYRVGPYGFLSFGNESSCKGNMGLLDQVMALRWVKENIHGFGGDSNNITLMGESAGGYAVGYHLRAKISQGLFHKAISQSGTGNMPLKIRSGDPDEVRKIMLDALGIHDEDPDVCLQKIKKVPAEDINRVALRMMLKLQYFGAIVDG